MDRPGASQVLGKGVLRAGAQLGLTTEDLERIVGVDRGSWARLEGERRIDPDSKEGELALLFLRVFRSLDLLLGGDRERCRLWLHATNHHLPGKPVELLRSAEGLVAVALYLDAVRGAGRT